MFVSKAEERRWTGMVQTWSVKHLREQLEVERAEGNQVEARIIQDLLLEREASSHSKEGF